MPCSYASRNSSSRSTCHCAWNSSLWQCVKRASLGLTPDFSITKSLNSSGSYSRGPVVVNNQNWSPQKLTHWLKIRDMRTQFWAWLATQVLGLIAKIEIKWPKLCTPKWSELHGVRPEHEHHNTTRQVTVCFTGWSHEFFLSFNECLGRVQFSVNSDITGFIWQMTPEFIWFVVVDTTGNHFQ